MGKHPSYVSTMAFSIEKKVFDEIGQFDTRFKSAGGEEFKIGMSLREYNYKIVSDQTFYVHHHYQYFWPRCKTLFSRSYVFGKIFLKRNFKFDKGHGTMKEGINAMVSMIGVLSLIISAFLHYFILLFFISLIMQMILDMDRNIYIIKKRGLLFFIKSIPVNYVWYLFMGLGVVKAVLVYYYQKVFKKGTAVPFF
jgi:hypothetical protein